MSHRARGLHDGKTFRGLSVNREVVVQYLNQALGAQLASLVRTKRHYYAMDARNEELRGELLEKAIDGSMHTDRIVERILELGGSPNFEPSELTAANDRNVGGLAEVITEDLEAQRSAIANYQDIMSNLENDAASCHVLEAIIRRDQHYIERLSRHLGNA